jgi:POT family proton-dependent oligopeptide transporter
MGSADDDDKAYAPPADPEDKKGAAGDGEEERPVPMTEFEKRFRHPPGLFILFFTEMWERFSYYGMRGLLKLYMVNYLFITLRQTLQGGKFDGTGSPDLVAGWSFVRTLLPAPGNVAECVAEKAKELTAADATMAIEQATKIAEQTCAVGAGASYLYGAYTALVYLTPLLGGIVADRLFGQRRTVVVGGVLMAIGHFIMAFEGWFFIALLFLIVGNGAFKPNISTQVGNLYGKNDGRRDGAFTIFYMGINLGAFICNLVCGTLAALYGWHYGFGAAGVGMCIGLVIYIAGQKYLAPDNMMKAKASAESKETKKAAAPEEKHPLTTEEWKRVGALVALCALNVVFWAVYEQQGNTMQTWADTKTVWPTILGFQIPSTWFQSFNPFFIFLLAPVLDMFWAWQQKRGKEPTSVTKMAIGCILLGLRSSSWSPATSDRRRGREGQPVLAGRLHARAHGRRALPLAHRPVARHQGVPRAHRLDDDGHVVPLELLRQLPLGRDRRALRGPHAQRAAVLLPAHRARHRHRPRDLRVQPAAQEDHRKPLGPSSGGGPRRPRVPSSLPEQLRPDRRSPSAGERTRRPCRSLRV